MSVLRSQVKSNREAFARIEQCILRRGISGQFACLWHKIAIRSTAYLLTLCHNFL